MFSLLLLGAASASGFGDTELRLVGEFDTAGSEFLVDLAATPLTGTLGRTQVDLLRTDLSWGIAPRVDRLDQLRIRGVEGEQVYGADTVASFWLGSIDTNRDARLFELGLVGGGVTIPVGALRFSLGGDTRMRALGDAFGEDWSVFLGLPLGVEHTIALPGKYTNLHLGAAARPSLGLLGKTAFTLDASGSVAVVYRVIAEESLKLDLTLEDRLGYDSFTDLDLYLENRLFFGIAADF